jgi:FlaA1/EpsC-like NDP-sugar epimerase
MTIEYDIIIDKKLVLAKGSGVITAIDVISHLDVLAADNRYKAPMKKLVDYRTIDSIRISMKEAYSIAQKKIKLSGRFTGERCAFVSPGGGSFGSSLVHQMLVDGVGFNTAVFKHMEDALKWLNVELDMKHENG